MNQLEHAMERVLQDPEKLGTLGDSVENLLFVWTALLQEQGREGWLSRATDALGNPLFSAEEAPKVEAQIKPLTDAILAFSKDRPLPQTGGGDLKGLDEYVKGVGEEVEKVDETMHEFSKHHGTLYYQELDDKLDKDPTLGPIGIPLIPLDESFSYNILSKIPIPLRTIIFLTNISLDALRLMVSVPGLQFPFMRKILSIGQAIFEVLQGDWKQALLSLAGVYSETAVYFGIFGKVFMNLFAMINPEFQEQILDGVVPVAKSLMIGFLLKGFQITAPGVVRRVVIDQMDKIRAQKEELDEALQKADLPPRPEYYAPTFQDIQDIQAVVRDKRLVCTAEYKTFMMAMNQSIYIKLAFQLVGLPMDMDTYNETCKDIQEQFPGKADLTSADVLVAQAKQAEETTQEAPTEAPTEAPAQEPATEPKPSESANAGSQFNKPVAPTTSQTRKQLKPTQGGRRTLRKRRV
jgi:hypothetical protein